MRITSGMIARQYSKNLNSSLSSLNYYSNRATNDRKFNKASEDPFSAAQAYKIRRETQQNSDYTSNYEDVNSMLLTGESAMRSVNSVAQSVASTDVIQAINGTMSSAERDIIATKITKMQETIVASANTKYADQYIFGGSGTSTPPFTVENGKLLYRGVDVDTGVNTNGASSKIGDTTINFGKDNSGKLNGYTIQITKNATAGTGVNSINLSAPTIQIELNADGATNDQLQTALQGFDTTHTQIPTTDFSKVTVGGNSTAAVSVSTPAGAPVPSAISNQVDLKALATEPMYVDLGLGMSFDSTGKLNSQSVFDASMPGISYLGYGTSTVNGTEIPNNLYSIMSDMVTKLKDPNFSIDKIEPYMTQFNNSQQNLLTKITEFGSKSNFLDFTKTRLDDQSDSLATKTDSIEYVDSADAIMDYKMQDYAYRAALQMGTNILQPTILDFMK